MIKYLSIKLIKIKVKIFNKIIKISKEDDEQLPKIWTNLMLGLKLKEAKNWGAFH